MLCGLLVDAHGCFARDQKYVTKSTLVQTGKLIMIGNIVQLLYATIVHSLIHLYMDYNSTHALLLSKK